MTEIEVGRAGQKWTWKAAGLIGISSKPFLDAARALLKAGHDPEERFRCAAGGRARSLTEARSVRRSGVRCGNCRVPVATPSAAGGRSHRHRCAFLAGRRLRKRCLLRHFISVGTGIRDQAGYFLEEFVATLSSSPSEPVTATPSAPAMPPELVSDNLAERKNGSS